ncbi:radical SAM protein [Ruminiclostridium papyrosolvens]|uniref:Radical SAM core domain-containing protein n=1 Tax=Ruminiclostridium papyrosolvens C7 TaxID=1330534 RepID=U4R1N3_9FIRM|nr:radical SAM protein [Ruminiclostridium papyrosolvens]EPR10585.1 hypothetical protein L323_13790 [Ruminiclostridium papyrosolvens C7]
MKKKLLLCDMVIAKNLCNASCEYCLTNYDNYDPGQACLRNEYKYEKGTNLYQRLNYIIDTLQQKLDIGALKISGGEILLVKNIISLLEERSSQFINVQLMTNGILLNDESISRLKAIPNFYLQISFDSSDFEGNFYRNKNRNMHDRLLKNIDKVLKSGIPLEINCVVTDRSIAHLSNFLDYLKQYEGYPLKVFPFPVRGDEVEKYFPKEEQISEIDKIIDNYHNYESIIPPVQYWEGLKLFLQNKRRQRICMIPYHTFQFFDDGKFTPCPYWWTVELGNLFRDSEAVIDNFQTAPVYRMLLASKPKLGSCDHCYIRSEVLNLYFEGVLSKSDIKTIPFYGKPEMLEFLEKVKADYLELHGRKLV